MGDTFDFRNHMGKRKRRTMRRYAPVILAGLAIGGGLGVSWPMLKEISLPKLTSGNTKQAETPSAADFDCASAHIVDGDTLRCGSLRVRLAHIDAPEMPGHCKPGRECAPGDPYASTGNLARLIAGARVTCRQIDVDRYGRAVALCRANGRDLSCEQHQGGFAIERYGLLTC